jgi:DNA polymerase III epsilon subunit-like protein
MPSWDLKPPVKARTPKTRLLSREDVLLAVMSHTWFQQFAGHFGFPDNYTTLDTETSGFSPAKKLVCMVGYTVVRDRVPVDIKEYWLNWPSVSEVDQDVLAQDLENVENGMTKQGKRFHHTYANLQKYGRPPREVLQELLDFFLELEARNEVLIMQNGWKFDVAFLETMLHDWLDTPFCFREDLVYDTGICEKASQLPDNDNPLPFAGESLKDFTLRIGSLRRKGVMWSLDGHCEGRYGLAEKAKRLVKAGSSEQYHRAGYDSLALHVLFEEHRRLAEIAPRLQQSTGWNPQAIVDNDDDDDD